MPENTPPKVSVLVPIYNVERFLVECLDSLVAQTFGDFEVICVNDGSTDGSRDIIVSYVEKDTRFRLIDKTNSGYGASMNRGLDAAVGTYIAILESDDFYAPETLERLVGTLEEYDAQVVKANCYYYWPGPPVKNVLYGLVVRGQTGRLVNPQEERDIFYQTPAVWGAIYRRDFLVDNDIRFNETPGASYQDTSFNFKVWVNATRAVFLREAFVHYRQDNVNSSVKSPGKVYCVCDEYAEMERYLASRPESAPDWLLAVKAKMKFSTYLWNYERLADEFQLEFMQRMSAELNDELEQGHLDWQMFEEWNKEELASILQSPEAYHQRRLSAGNRSKFGKALHFLRTGGVPLLFKVLVNKYAQRP
ncbi:MAG: glycosyltransferase [Coriobacteriia bacterium]|nr:glycosyltransferase [Coriobacteriia bacterium]